MTEEEQIAINYRFSGYQMPLVQYDETGPAYAVIREVHPYFKNQPLYWSKPAYGGVPPNQGVIGTDIRTDSPPGMTEAETSSASYQILPIDFI